MKNIKLLTLLSLFFFGYFAQGQILKSIGDKAKNAAERTIERKIADKSAQKTGQVMDTILNQDKKISKKKRRKKRSRNTSQNSNTSTQTQKANYNSDFEPGTMVIYEDHFSQDALNDFPVSWNTNGSGAIVTFGNSPTKWLRMEPDISYTPNHITSIPKNATLEFDLKVDDNYFQISKGIDLIFAQFNTKDIDFNQYYQYEGKKKKNSVEIRLDPISHTSYGSYANTFIDGKRIIEKTLGKNNFNENNRSVHISLWRQDTRLRLYIDGQKIWDLPRAFSPNVNYNTFMLATYKGKPDDAFYISNLRLAHAGEDTRHALLENGSYSTHDILFESGNSTLKSSSISTIQELVNVLNSSPNTKVKIIGHTDSDGSEATNLELSRERAYSVKEKMIKLGITQPKRISVEGRGESQPLADNSTAAGKAQNRRVEFIIIQ